VPRALIAAFANARRLSIVDSEIEQMSRDDKSANPAAIAAVRRDNIETLNIADDRLNGAQEIAVFRGEPIHRTRYLIRKGLIPVAREGERIAGSKRRLREHYFAATSGKGVT
jgi:hypothetical protein